MIKSDEESVCGIIQQYGHCSMKITYYLFYLKKKNPLNLTQ
jgi:hypothetical protein